MKFYSLKDQIRLSSSLTPFPICATKYAFQDPFGDVIKKIMNAIHDHAQLSPACDLGSQNYEQWVVQKERQGERSTSVKLPF